MRKWRIEISWECEVEAYDEGIALAEADAAFKFYREANVEEIEPSNTSEQQPSEQEPE